MKKEAFTIHSFVKLSEEKNMEYKNYTLDQALDFVLADSRKFEELDSDSDYECDNFEE